MPKGDRGTRGYVDYGYSRKFYDPKYRANQSFRGVDGEGGNVQEEGTLFGVRHQYLSLRAGPNLLETGKPLSWEECFKFLTDQPWSYIYVSYFFDYDVTMMIRTLPMNVALKLLDRAKRGTDLISKINSWTEPVSYGGYEFDYLPHKEFKIRRDGQKKYTVISDVGQFFQSSFLTALERWNIGTPEEREMIRRGKSMRSEFTEFTEETRAYNALECLLLEQLMTNFRAVCEETNYVPKKWQGPGYLASAMLSYHEVPRRDDIPILGNDSFRTLAQAAYYGGRFEISATGPIAGPVYQYDINGAYVGLLRTLPCLLHGTWRQIRKRPSGGLWFGRVHFDHPPSPDAPRYLCGLPFRTSNGNINYPRQGIGVYWSVEIEAAERAGTATRFESGWVYDSNCSCRWFDFVDSYYEQRLRLGKSAKGMVLKLAGNSIYGKLAQSIGYAPYANPVWAGLITAGCRAQLIDAYRQAPEHCYMLATDGLFMGVPLNLPVSKKLGEWEETIHPDGIFIVQPGVYFVGDEAKSRGVERGKIHDMRALFDAQFTKYMESGGSDHTVSIDVDNFITARQAIQRNRWDLAGTWDRTERQISYYWGLKRTDGLAHHDGRAWRHYPHHGWNTWESAPYSRMIGGGLRVNDQDRYIDIGLQEDQRMGEQPDWVEPLL